MSSRHATLPGEEAPFAYASLIELNRRAASRVVIPPDTNVHVQLSTAGALGTSLHGSLRDISYSGLLLRLREAPPLSLRVQDSVAVLIEHESLSVRLVGSVVRHAGRDVTLRFSSADEMTMFNLPLLTLMLRIVTRHLDVATADQFIHLKHPPRHNHYFNGSYLDVRVERGDDPWWQIVFLEYYVDWSPQSGLRRGVLGQGPDVVLGPIEILGAKTAQFCQQRLPEHAADFVFIQQTLYR